MKATSSGLTLIARAKQLNKSRFICFDLSALPGFHSGGARKWCKRGNRCWKFRNGRRFRESRIDSAPPELCKCAVKTPRNGQKQAELHQNRALTAFKALISVSTVDGRKGWSK